MSRWIEVDVLRANINTTFWSEIEKIIESAPSIDIVRCKECKYARNIGSEWMCKHLSGMVLIKADDFCSYGERSEP